MNKMVINHTTLIVIFMMFLGLVLIVMAFISQMLALQIAIALAGAAFISSGVVLLSHDKDKKREEERHRQIMEKLEELRQELEKKEEPQNEGVAIADVISSGLKYYADYLRQPEKEKDDD